MPARKVNPPQTWVNEPQLFTLDEFVKAHRISRGKFYLMRAAGDGPELTQIGTRRFISRESAAKWVKKHTKREH